jgi:hypothetical protein
MIDSLPRPETAPIEPFDREPTSTPPTPLASRPETSPTAASVAPPSANAATPATAARPLSPEEAQRRTAELQRLGEEIAELSLQIDAATYQLLVMIREFDERGGWDGGFRSCAHWMSWRTGTDLGAARERVRVARALADLPLVSEALRKGEVSYSKVRAISRVATPETEGELLRLAKAGTACHLERIVRGLRRVDRLQAVSDENRRDDSRYLSAHVDEDGMVVVRGRLPPEAGAVFLRALDAAQQQLFDVARQEKAQSLQDASPEQRRADALGLMAESALSAGLDPGTRGDRYQVVLHVEAEALPADSDTGAGVLDGQGVAAETCRRFTCDSARVLMRHAPDGSVLDVGRRTRAISPGLRRALEHRDGGCRFPGCTVRVCDAHHVKHWADGGETSMGNTILCCKHHHRLLHEGGFTMELSPAGEARFFRPDGRLVEEAPAIDRKWRDAVAAVSHRLRCQQITIDVPGSVPLWEGGPVDYGWAVEGLLELRERSGRREPTDVPAETCYPAPASPRETPRLMS